MALISFGDDNVATLSEARGDLIITPLDDEGNLIPLASFTFQYFPEEISDDKDINMQTKELAGGSLPIYQFISAGERTISFTAMFSSDVDHVSQAAASSSFLFSVTARDNYERVKEAGLERRNIDARTAITNLRAFMLPRYMTQAEGAAETKPPPRLRLFIPGSGIGVTGGISEAGHGPDAMFCVMTQCNVTYHKFFPSGFPRLVSVDLSFAQVPQLGNRIKFPNSMLAYDSSSLATHFSLIHQAGGALPSDASFLPYTLQPRKKVGQ